MSNPNVMSRRQRGSHLHREAAITALGFDILHRRTNHTGSVWQLWRWTRRVQSISAEGTRLFSQ
jgi:hypothetical protein